MGKQKFVVGTDDRKAGRGGANAPPAANADQMKLPAVGNAKRPRTLAAPAVLLEDQILLYPDALTSSECASVVSLFTSSNDALAMQASPPAKKGEAERTNFRFSTVSPDFARQLYVAIGLADAVKDWPSMFTPKTGDETDQLRPVGLSSNIRIYRYDPGAHFACHYDDHSVDPHYGLAWGRTEWTLLVYLTGEPDVEGGQTVFYKAHSRPRNGVQSDKAIVAPLQRGAALLHRHGKVCLLHEALPPTRGTKWVLRSDLVFGRRGQAS